MLVIALLTFVVVCTCVSVLDAISKGWLMDRGIGTIRLVEKICKLTVALAIITLTASILAEKIL